jgi:hypothetical protein
LPKLSLFRLKPHGNAWRKADARSVGDGYQFVVGLSRIFHPSFIRSLRFCSTSASMEERRTKPRRRVLKAGMIEFDGSTVDCTIRNISPIGAALDVASPVGIPHEITLNVVTRHERQNCHVVWRKQKRIGVAFGDQD